MPNCGISRDKGLMGAAAAKLQNGRQLKNFAAVGTPTGSAEFPSKAQEQCAGTVHHVEMLVDTLVQPPLAVQAVLVLRASLQSAWRISCRRCLVRCWRCTYAPRALLCVRCGSCAGPCARGGGVPHRDGTAQPGAQPGQQAYDVPVASCGLGIRTLSDVAVVVVAGQAEHKLKVWPAALCPL